LGQRFDVENQPFEDQISGETLGGFHIELADVCGWKTIGFCIYPLVI
jgi:hypothetical protein